MRSRCHAFAFKCASPHLSTSLNDLHEGRLHHRFTLNAHRTILIYVDAVRFPPLTVIGYVSHFAAINKPRSNLCLVGVSFSLEPFLSQTTPVRSHRFDHALPLQSDITVSTMHCHSSQISPFRPCIATPVRSHRFDHALPLQSDITVSTMHCHSSQISPFRPCIATPVRYHRFDHALLLQSDLTVSTMHCHSSQISPFRPCIATLSAHHALPLGSPCIATLLSSYLLAPLFFNKI